MMSICAYYSMEDGLQVYDFGNVIGEGQYGKVYKVCDKRTNRLYALKKIPISRFQQNAQLAGLTSNQIHTLKQISHPHIVKFYDKIDGKQYISMIYQYCQGGTLKQLLTSKKKLPETEAISIFIQIRSAFLQLNRNHIMHRDIKPQNILFHNRIVKLADFGFCKRLNTENPMTKTILGSPYYMSPEIMDQREYDCRSDIWSMGVVLYEMLYGTHPYVGASLHQLQNAIQNGYLKFQSTVPLSEWVKNLIKRMLTINPQDRLSFEELAQYDLESRLRDMRSIRTLTDHREVCRFIRNGIVYQVQTLQLLTPQVDQFKYLRIIYLVFKLMLIVEYCAAAASEYWNTIRVINKFREWDSIFNKELELLKPYGLLVKETLSKYDTSLQTKMELEAFNVDTKYFTECLLQLKEENLVERLYNCLLIARHFVLVMESKSPDWTDYTKFSSLAKKVEIIREFAIYH